MLLYWIMLFQIILQQLKGTNSLPTLEPRNEVLVNIQLELNYPWVFTTPPRTGDPFAEPSPWDGAQSGGNFRHAQRRWTPMQP